MKFKQNEQPAEKEGMSKELYDKFIELIQMEVDKLSFISSAKLYFYSTGQMNYKKFFKHLHKNCEELKHCLIGFLINQMEDIPSFTIPKLDIDFKDDIEPFKKMAEYEDTFIEKLNDIITQAYNDKNWQAFHYLLKKLDGIDHICCRALAAVEHGADVLQLCEQPSKEK